MIFIICILVGVLYGTYRKRKHPKAKTFVYNKKWLLYLLLITQVLFRVGIIVSGSNMLLQASLILGLILTIIFLGYNIKNTTIVYTAIGYILNSVVMIFNNGKMPSLINKTIQLDIRHSIIRNDTRLYFLGDIIHLPYPFDYWSYMLSIGDIFIAIGVLFLTYNLTVNKIQSK